MVRNPSRFTPSHPDGVANDQRPSRDRAPNRGYAKVSSTPKSGPAEQRTVWDTPHRSALPSWVLTRAADRSANPLKSEPEQLMVSDDYLNCAEVAALLRVSLRTVHRLISGGRIPHIRVGRQVRILRGKLTNLLLKK